MLTHSARKSGFQWITHTARNAMTSQGTAVILFLSKPMESPFHTHPQKECFVTLIATLKIATGQPGHRCTVKLASLWSSGTTESAGASLYSMGHTEVGLGWTCIKAKNTGASEANASAQAGPSLPVRALFPPCRHWSSDRKPCGPGFSWLT